MRKAFVLIHRYAGLYMALFLIVAGLTGSILAFDGEIRDWLDPPPRVAVRAQPMLDAVELHERAEALEPRARVDGLTGEARLCHRGKGLALFLIPCLRRAGRLSSGLGWI